MIRRVVRREVSALLLHDELLDLPVLERVVGKVPPDDEGDLLGRELLEGDLERVRLTLDGDKDGGIHPAG